MYRFLFFILVLSISFFSCKKSINCDSNIACTEEFRSITAEITVQTGHPLLDSYSTTRIKDGILVKDNEGLVWGTPIILSDSEIKETTLEGEEFLFEAYKDGVKVISEEYVVKHDCCHIIKVSGKDTINL